MHSRRFAPRPTRRDVLAGALAVGTGLVVPRSVLAQDATPAALTEPIASHTREEFVPSSRRSWGTPRPPPLAAPSSTPTSPTSRPSTRCWPKTVRPLPSSVSSTTSSSAAMSAPGSPRPTVWPTTGRSPPDGRTYTFHLNQDAKWHDGTDITADDVQFSFDALANPDVGSAYYAEFRRRGRVVAGDRRAHLRGGRQGAALHLPLRPRHLDHPQAHLGGRAGRRLAHRRRRHRAGSVARRRLRSLGSSRSGGRARASRSSAMTTTTARCPTSTPT